MMKIKYRVILLAALVLGWMGVIFMFSSQDGAASSETSGRVVERVIAVVKPDFNSLAKSEQIRFREMVTFFVRKGGAAKGKYAYNEASPTPHLVYCLDHRYALCSK